MSIFLSISVGGESRLLDRSGVRRIGKGWVGFGMDGRIGKLNWHVEAGWLDPGHGTTVGKLVLIIVASAQQPRAAWLSLSSSLIIITV